MSAPIDVKNLKIVIIESLYDTWTNPVVQDLFNKVVSLKLAGYRSAYRYGVIPLDTYDFIGTHKLVCEVRGGELFPVMGYKSTTLSRARIHRLPFPALAILKQSGAQRHAEILQGLLDRCSAEQREIAYDGSWTIAPEVRESKATSELLKKLMMMISVSYHSQIPGKEVTGFGMPRFKTDRYFMEFGFKPLEADGAPLPPLGMNTLQDEPAVLLHLTKFADSVLQIANDYARYWQQRLVFEAPAEASTEKRAA